MITLTPQDLLVCLRQEYENERDSIGKDREEGKYDLFTQLDQLYLTPERRGYNLTRTSK